MSYSGCKYVKNNGDNEYQPKGTATAMHECGDCKKLPYCRVKQTNEVFPFEAQDAEEHEKAWATTQAIAKTMGHP